MSIANSLWFAEKFVSLLIEQHRHGADEHHLAGCDLLKNSYLCLLNNTWLGEAVESFVVVICWKIRIFAYWTTPERGDKLGFFRCDLLKNSYLCLLNNTKRPSGQRCLQLWFAEKFVSLLIEQHPFACQYALLCRCDLLKNSYLCLLNNTAACQQTTAWLVVICWKIRIFAYWTTPDSSDNLYAIGLWFAEKFVSLLIEQHRTILARKNCTSCDLLKNSYLCLLNNTKAVKFWLIIVVVICWKIRIFAYWTTPPAPLLLEPNRCDLLKNSYLCLLNNTGCGSSCRHCKLWFAEKFVSLLIEQHLPVETSPNTLRCDLLKNSYLCLLNNTLNPTFDGWLLLWFAEKFVSLLIEQHLFRQIGSYSAGCDLLKNSYLCLLNNTRGR